MFRVEKMISFRFTILAWLMASGLLAWSAVGCSSNVSDRLAEKPGSTAEKAAPIQVRLSRDESGSWTLIRGEQPFRIQGAGGDGSLELLAACGGNSTRLWGVDGNTKRRLDEAHRAGLTVAVGIWLEHSQKGFDYANTVKVKQQFDQVIAAVKQYKDHPAVLVWGLGNEMEGYETGANPDLWQHVESLAKAIKEIDPNHPTMTVVAELTPDKVKAIHQHCPSLDIIGINSYGGCPTLPERYRQHGGTKPYIVTEFGPVGTWEVPKNNIDAIEEPTSVRKAGMYREAYRKLAADRELCLGSYAFLWGNKQEGTATWFGLLLPTGEKTNAVDVLTEEWTGKPPANRCPEIASLRLVEKNEIEPGQKVKLELLASDPDGDQLQVNWTVMQEADRYVTGGDPQSSPPVYPEAVESASETGCTVALPKSPGMYRVYVEALDGKGQATTANLPIRVSEPVIEAGPAVALPYTIYSEAALAAEFAPSGWMGDTSAVVMTPESKDLPHTGETCLKCEYKAAAGWAGVVWQNPEGDWGEKPGGKNFAGAKRLVFWARGAEGGEKLKVGFGLLGREKPYFDTTKKEQEFVLSTEWQQFEIDLSGQNLQRIKSPFFWVHAAAGKPATFYFDDVVIE